MNGVFSVFKEKDKASQGILVISIGNGIKRLQDFLKNYLI